MRPRTETAILPIQPLAPASGVPEPLGADVLAAALEASHVAVTISDVTRPEQPLRYVNAGFEAITGYRREEVLGRNCRFLQGPETDPEAVAALRRAIRGRTACDVELLNYRRDGRPFWNSLHLAPLRNARGETTAFIGIQRDVTHERSQRERERQHDRMLALGRLAGGVAHEINNLLQPVLTLPDIIAEDLPPNAREARADLALVAESARDARAIVRRLLDFGRPPAPSATPIPFADALYEAIATARTALPGTVTLETRVDTGPLATLLDRTEVKQVLLNLAGNAADAMAGRGTVFVEAVPGPVGIRWIVADDGPGIPVGMRERVFEPFCGTKPAGRGSGLGLFIVQEIVRRVGGAVRVTDAPGGGAIFVIDIPIAPHAAASAPHGAPAEEAA